MSFEDSIAEIKRRIDLSQVVGRYVSLKKKGKHYLGLCPFHQEKTPSFYVHQDEGYFKCFGCGEAGDVFTFLQKQSGQLFLDVARSLGQEVGIAIAPTLLEKGSSSPPKQALIDAMAAISQFFEGELYKESGKGALTYLLDKRGLSNDEVKAWGIGFCAQNDRILLEYLRQAQISSQLALELGVMRKGKFGNYPFFSGRIIIPIKDRLGRVIGFGGRIFGTKGNNAPKYLNSPQSALYDKSKVLFGIDKALVGLKGKAAVLVEGYFDVIAIQQIGFPGLAPCGTSLTGQHLSLLAKYTRRIILCFDQDDAGRMAEEKALLFLLKNGFEVQGVGLALNDPDAMVRNGRADELRRSLLGARDAVQSKILSLSRVCFDNISERIRAIDNLKPFLAASPRELVCRQYVRFASLKLGEDEGVMLRELKFSPLKKINKSVFLSGYTNKNEDFTAGELLFLRAVVAHPQVLETIDDEIFERCHSELGDFFRSLAAKLRLKHKESPRSIFNDLNVSMDSQLFTHLKDISGHEHLIKLSDARKIVEDFVRKVASIKQKNRLARRHKKLILAEEKGDFEAVKKVLEAQTSQLRASSAKKKDLSVELDQPGKTNKNGRLLEKDFDGREDPVEAWDGDTGWT